MRINNSPITIAIIYLQLSLYSMRILIVIFILLNFTRCGQPMLPTGGPRDSIPPVLLKAFPKDSALLVKPTKIQLDFNEFLETIQDPRTIVYSPLPKRTPEIEVKLKVISIAIKDTLEENTTYTINFGNTIKDINESNPLRNFTYVFSTGASIDTGKLSGKVLLAETGKPDSTISVVLQRDLSDTAAAKTIPRYIARLNKDGNFNFNFLKPGKYNVFALLDADGKYTYDQPSEIFGFLDSTIVVSTTTTTPLKIYAFLAEQDKPKKPFKPAATAPVNKDDKRFRYTTNLDGRSLDILGDLVLKFDKKPTEFDTSKISLRNDNGERLANYNIVPDSNLFHIEYPWQPGEKYRLYIEKNLAKDSLGNYVVKNDTLKIEAKKDIDYGSLMIRTQELDTTYKPVLLFFKDDKLFKSIPIRAARIAIKKLLPAEFELRILFDSNNNGKWDTGDYWKKIQPELIKPRKEKLVIKANWDNEVTINFPEVVKQ
jgi:uncharacterized protein (DUF2141 family)